MVVILVLSPGDSGGALMVFSATRRWILAGIILGTCSQRNQSLAAGFTRVTSFVDWIRSMNITDSIFVTTADAMTMNMSASTDYSQNHVGLQFNAYFSCISSFILLMWME